MNQRRVFKIKNDLKKIQYVIKKMENVMNDNKLQRKKCLISTWIFEGFFWSWKINWKERKTKQINSSLFNSIVYYCECVKKIANIFTINIIYYICITFYLFSNKHTLILSHVSSCWCHDADASQAWCCRVDAFFDQ